MIQAVNEKKEKKTNIVAMCKTTVITEVNIPRPHLFVQEPTCITINIGCRPRHTLAHTLAHTRIVARPQTHTRIPVSGSSMLDQEYQFSLQSVRKKKHLRK